MNYKRFAPGVITGICLTILFLSVRPLFAAETAFATLTALQSNPAGGQTTVTRQREGSNDRIAIHKVAKEPARQTFSPKDWIFTDHVTTARIAFQDNGYVEISPTGSIELGDKPAGSDPIRFYNSYGTTHWRLKGGKIDTNERDHRRQPLAQAHLVPENEGLDAPNFARFSLLAGWENTPLCVENLPGDGIGLPREDLTPHTIVSTENSSAEFEIRIDASGATMVVVTTGDLTFANADLNEKVDSNNKPIPVPGSKITLHTAEAAVVENKNELPRRIGVILQNKSQVLFWTREIDPMLIPDERRFINLTPQNFTKLQQLLLAEHNRKKQPQAKTPAASSMTPDDLLEEGDWRFTVAGRMPIEEQKASYERAVGLYNQALTAYPKTPTLWEKRARTQAHLGYAYIKQEKLAEAEKAFVDANKEALSDAVPKPVQQAQGEESPQQKQGYSPAWVGRAWVEAARKSWQEAENDAELALGIAQQQADVADQVDAWIVLGVIEIRQNRRYAAEFAFSRATDLEKTPQHATARPPDFYQAHAWKAIVLSSDYTRRKMALEEVKSAIYALKQPEHSGLVQTARTLTLLFNSDASNEIQRNTDLREAEKAAKLAVEVEPASAAAMVLRGLAMAARGHLDTPKSIAQKAAAQFPCVPETHYLLGIVCLLRGDYADASKAMEATLHLEPRFPEALQQLAFARIKQGNKAIKDTDSLMKTLKSIPDEHEAQAAQGSLNMARGKFKDAQKSYEQAITLLETGKPGTAPDTDEITDPAPVTWPQNQFSPVMSGLRADYYNGSARARLYQDCLEGAIRRAQQAVDFAPNIAQYHADLGLTYDFSNLTVQAEREYRLALGLNSENALARLRLGAVSPDPGLRISSITQAFLYDHEVQDHLLRYGRSKEYSLGIGANGRWNATGTLRGDLDNGRGRFFFTGSNLLESSTNGLGGGTQTYLESSDGSYRFTYSSPNQVSLLNYTDEKLHWKVPDLSHEAASVIFPTDNRNSAMQLATRLRAGVGDYVWLGMSYITNRTEDLFPLFSSGPTPVLTGRTKRRFEEHFLAGEARGDLTLTPYTVTPTVLTLGAGITPVNIATRTDTPAGNTDTHGTLWTTYAQLSSPITSRLSLTGQVRYQDFYARLDPVISAGNSSNGPSILATARLLPSVMMHYRPGGKTLLRLLMNWQSPELELPSTTLSEVDSETYRVRALLGATPFTLRPTDTLLAVERSTVPAGNPSLTSTLELDAEHYFARNQMIKVFGFYTGAEVLNGLSLQTTQLGPDRSANTSLYGLGIRYEWTMGRSFFANLSFVGRGSLNRDTKQTALYEPDHVASLHFDYITPQGVQAGIVLRNAGSFLQSTPDRSHLRFPSKIYVDLRYTMRLQHTFGDKLMRTPELFVEIANLFNERQIDYNNAPVGERRIQIGILGGF